MLLLKDMQCTLEPSRPSGRSCLLSVQVSYMSCKCGRLLKARRSDCDTAAGQKHALAQHSVVKFCQQVTVYTVKHTTLKQVRLRLLTWNCDQDNPGYCSVQRSSLSPSNLQSVSQTGEASSEQRPGTLFLVPGTAACLPGRFQ